MVYGGTVVPPSRFSRYVELFMHEVGGSGTMLCGGTLVSKNLVVTAAHCVWGTFDSVTVLSADERFSVTALSWSVNPLYDPVSLDRWKDDIAFVHLASPLPLLPGPELDMNWQWKSLADRAALTLVGRGLSCGTGARACLSRTLLEAQLPKISPRLCIGNMPWQWPDSVGRDALCAGGGGPVSMPEACPGDSGGPLFSGTTLFGVVSAGDTTNSECGGNLRPTLFAGISYSASFVAEHIGVNVTRKAVEELTLSSKSSGGNKTKRSGVFIGGVLFIAAVSFQTLDQC
jgi:secreted trypsin-like serine protease